VALLAEIFRASLNEGIVSFDWRVSIITPIFKNGPKKNLENYGPVSLTSQIGKIFEFWAMVENVYNAISLVRHIL